MGLLIGLASSVKFTGLLLIPPYLARRLVRAGPRLQGVCLAGVITVVVALTCTPYAWLHAGEYRHGPARQLNQYYPGASGLTFFEKLLYFLDAEMAALGPVGSLLALVGAILCLRRLRSYWGPALVHPFATILVMSTGALVFQRYILPAIGLVDLLAAAPVAVLAARRRVVAAVLTSVAVAVPLHASFTYARYVSRPSAEDAALDWIVSHVPPGSRILETRPDADPGGRAGAAIGVDPIRYETVHLTPGEDRIGVRLLTPEMSLVITGPGAAGRWASGLQTVYEARGASGDVALLLRVPDPRSRTPRDPVDLARSHLTASENRAALLALTDGDPKTGWSTTGDMTGGEWIEVSFDAPVTACRIELFYRDRPSRHDPEVEILVTEDGRAHSPARAIAVRPGLIAQAAASRRLSQLFVLNPRSIRGLRIVQLGRRGEPWALTELRVDAAVGKEVPK